MSTRIGQNSNFPCLEYSKTTTCKTVKTRTRYAVLWRSFHFLCPMSFIEAVLEVTSNKSAKTVATKPKAKYVTPSRPIQNSASKREKTGHRIAGATK